APRHAAQALRPRLAGAGLTLCRFPPRNRPLRGPNIAKKAWGPRGVSRPAVCAALRRQKPVGSANRAEQEEGAILSHFCKSEDANDQAPSGEVQDRPADGPEHLGPAEISD